MTNRMTRVAVGLAAIVAPLAASGVAHAGFTDCTSGYGCLWVDTAYGAVPGLQKNVSAQGYSYNFKSYGNRRQTQAVTFYNGNTKLVCMPPNTGNYSATVFTATRNVFSTSC